MKAWAIYRNGSMTLAACITAALEHYQIHNGGNLPKSIRVNACDLEKASAVVRVLGLQDLEVTANGGCLCGEVWTEAKGKTDLQKSAATETDLGVLAQPGANGGYYPG